MKMKIIVVQNNRARRAAGFPYNATHATHAT